MSNSSSYSASGSTTTTTASSSSAPLTERQEKLQLAQTIATKIPPLASFANTLVKILNGETIRQLNYVARVITQPGRHRIAFNVGEMVPAIGASGSAVAVTTLWPVTLIMCTFATSLRHWMAHKSSERHFSRIYEMANDHQYDHCEVDLKDAVTYTYVQKMRKADDAFIKAIPIAGTVRGIPGMIRGIIKFVKDTRGKERAHNAEVLIKYAGTRKRKHARDKKLARNVIEELFDDRGTMRRIVDDDEVDELAGKLKCVN